MENTRFCIKCGKEIPIDSEFCPYCGAKQPAISSSTTVANSDRSTDAKISSNSTPTAATSLKNQKHSHKKLWILVSLILIFIVAIGGGTYVYHRHQEAVAKQALQDKVDNFNDADSEFNSTAKKLTRELESLDDQTTKIWHDAIFDDSGAKVGGKYYTDFNKAVSANFDQAQANGKIDQLKSNKNYMKDEYKLLSSNVTSSNQYQYNIDKKTYNDLKSYWAIVTNPSGTYNDYSSNSTNANNKLVSDIQN